MGTGLSKWKNIAITIMSALRNCWISVRGAIKLHPFGTSAERIEAMCAKGVQFYCPIPAIVLLELYLIS